MMMRRARLAKREGLAMTPKTSLRPSIRVSYLSHDHLILENTGLNTN